MNKLLAASLALAAFMTTAAVRAADLPSKMYSKAPLMAAPVANWTGWYAGIAGGIGWGRDQIFRPFDGSVTPTLTKSGGIVGGTLGYNWQSAAFVYGLEADASWANIDPQGSDANVFPTCTAGGVGTCGTELQFLATARARAGYLITPGILLFGTGGVAFGELKESVTALGATTTASELRVGWTAGGGVEAMLGGNWTGKIEYEHVDLGNGPTTPVFAGLTWESQSWKADIVRVGLNYKLGWLRMGR